MRRGDVVAVTLFGTTLAVALVDTYSEANAGMLAFRCGPSRGGRRRLWRDVSPVLLGARAPTRGLVVAAFGPRPVGRALAIVEPVAFLPLFGYGWRVVPTRHRRRLRRLLGGLGLGAIGGPVVGIEAAFR